MSNIQRYRKAGGHVRIPVDSAVVVDIGDAIYLNTDDARPASGLTYVSGNLAGTQANFAAKFIGVAAEASESGDTDDITIDTSGVFEFDCASGTFEVGDLVGMDDNAGATALEDQKVIAIGENGYGAIGRVAKRYSANTTRVLVEIFQQNLSPHPLYIPVYAGAISNTADIVTAWAVQFPFKLVAIYSVLTVAATDASTVLTIDKDSTALDDTLTITTGSVGEYTRQAIDDATGDDIFIVGDTISIASDGGCTAGSALIVLEVRPYVLEA